MASLDSKLANVVGDRTAKVLETTFGYKTIADLIHHYPRRIFESVDKGYLLAKLAYLMESANWHIPITK